MAYLTASRRNGTTWIPEFVMKLDREKCIGCGRCYKACTQMVFNLKEEEDDDGNEVSFMEISEPENCIGCKSCEKVCSKHTMTYAPYEMEN